MATPNPEKEPSYANGPQATPDFEQELTYAAEQAVNDSGALTSEKSAPDDPDLVGLADNTDE
jgi:hypothetical protein